MSFEVFTYRVSKQPKVVFKKLGKEKAWGRYFSDKNLIEIDERLKGKKLLEIYVHEFLHHLFPNFSEDEIVRLGRELTEYLWKHNYRKIDNQI